MANNLEVEGLEEFQRALEEAPEIARPILERRMEQGLFLLEQELKPYPPQPARDRAATFNTYVRGRGHYPRSAFADGQFDSRTGTKLLRAGQVRLTSERLGTKWTHEIEWLDEAITGVIGNSASYADVVQGSKEDQNYWHGVTGWVTIDEALERHEEAIYRLFEEGVVELAEALS